MGGLERLNPMPRTVSPENKEKSIAVKPLLSGSHPIFCDKSGPSGPALFIYGQMPVFFWVPRTGGVASRSLVTMKAMKAMKAIKAIKVMKR